VSEPEANRLFATKLAGGLIGSDDTSIAVAEWTDPGGGGEPPLYIAPLHVHHDDDEAWYVLEGALRVRLGAEDVEVPAGGAVIAPRGTPHTYWNPGPEPARYLLVMTPRIVRLIDALHGLAERTPEAVAATFAEHRSEYLGWPA
jgi:mannose-6-phosphate isomerase-like protein (cupin superfamily)